MSITRGELLPGMKERELVVPPATPPPARRWDPPPPPAVPVSGDPGEIPLSEGDASR